MEGLAVNRFRTRHGRGTRRLLLAGVLALAAFWMLAGRAEAQQAGCSSGGVCVMMIQIDGLEAAEVTQETTPFLWELAHPTDGNPVTQDRKGFIWQAPRASMSAGLGANVSSFLVGGYAEQTGAPADEFFMSQEEGGSHLRLGGSTVDSSITDPTPGEVPACSGTSNACASVLTLVKDQIGDATSQHKDTTAAFIGDPNVGPLVVGGLDAPETDFAWYPTPGDQENPINPALCDIPRTPVPPPTPPSGQPACASSDAFLLNNIAGQALNAGNAGDVTLTYIELAELGHVKRSGGNVTATLASTDSALQTFFGNYSQQPNTTDQWPNTIVMVNGISGYESTPTTQRVPDPDTAEQDLANDVGEFDGGKFKLIPQGTVATVYPAGNPFNDTAASPSQAHRDSLDLLRDRILSVNNHASCQADNQPPAGPDLCVEEVLYMRPGLTPDGSATDTVEGDCPETGPPDPPDCGHPDWHLDHLKVEFNQQTGDTTTTPTGRSGDLLVVMKPGWAAGKFLPATGEVTSSDEIITNPYLASTGGPRNRAVASIINGGPTTEVRSLQGEGGKGWYVDDAPGGTAEEPVCEGSAELDNDPGHPLLAAANANPGDDANADGHECQAESLDFAPTVAALLKVAMPPDQICGRILNEAFNEPVVAAPDSDAAPDAYFTQGPVTPPAGQEYPQTDRNVTFEFDTTVKHRGIVKCGDTSTVETTFECKLDAAEFSPCSSPVTLGPLAKGIHEFCVRAISDTLKSDPDCAKFEVILFFDFDGVVRDLRATVTDYDGNSWATAARGRHMDRIAISADYGRPLNAVTLTLYKQSSGKVLCGQTVFRPQAAAASAKSAGGARRAASCPLTGLARFKPFKLDRGHVDLRLRIPSAYKPTHVGVTVQEVTANVLDAATTAQCQQTQNFFCFYSKVGAPEGGIVQIIDARRLHSVKGQKPCKTRKKAGKAAKGCKKKKKKK